MDAGVFAKRYPIVYHMADGTAWPSIRRHGLLSTRAIVDLYDPAQSVRAEILSGVRKASVVLEDGDLGNVTIRDQLPLKFLDECLQEGVTAQEFLDALNGRVYFWVAEARLERLLKAREYKHRRNLVLHVDTAALLEVHGATVELAPYNTGDAHVVPKNPWKRTPDVFVPLASYPFEEWQRKRRRSGEEVVELTVPGAVPDVADFIRRAELRQGSEKPIPVDLDG